MVLLFNIFSGENESCEAKLIIPTNHENVPTTIPVKINVFSLILNHIFDLLLDRTVERRDDLQGHSSDYSLCPRDTQTTTWAARTDPAMCFYNHMVQPWFKQHWSTVYVFDSQNFRLTRLTFLSLCNTSHLLESHTLPIYLIHILYVLLFVLVQYVQVV